MVILEILKYILPSIVVFFTAYYLFKEQSKKELEQQKIDYDTRVLEKNKEVLLPVKLQAYERLMLFLQRIHPNQMVIRNSSPNQNIMQLQSALMKSLRDEFEHNMSQQLYVSDASWDKVVNAKEECLKQINFAASKLNSDARGNELGALLINNYGKLTPDPTQEAIRQLKADVIKGL
jgi:hypothetical protein